MNADKVTKFLATYVEFFDELTRICKPVFDARFAVVPGNRYQFCSIQDFDFDPERGGIVAFCEWTGGNYEPEAIFIPISLFESDRPSLIAHGEGLRADDERKEAEKEEKRKIISKEERRLEFEQLKKEFEADIDRLAPFSYTDRTGI